MLTVQNFNGTSLTQTSVNTYKDFPKGSVFEDVIEVNDYIYILFSAWDKPNETEQLFVRKINKTNGQLEGNSELLIFTNQKITGGDGDKFKITLSFDKSKILIHYRLKPDNKRDKFNKDVIGLYVFTEKLAQIWSKEVEMPYTEAKMENIDYAIDKGDNVFILAEVLRDSDIENKFRGRNTNFDYELITVQPTGISANTKITLDGKLVNQIRFFEGKNNSLFAAGTYSNNEGSFTDGIFYSSITKSGDQIDFKSFEIPTDIIKQFTSEKTQKKIDKSEEAGKNIGIENFVLRQILFEDDNIIFAGEKYYYNIHVDKEGNETYYYYSEEMLIAKVDSEGKLLFIKKLPKKQMARSANPPSRYNLLGMNMFSKVFDGGSLGYRLIKSSENYYLLFLDNVKNLELDPNKAPEIHQNGKGGFLTSYQINKESGEVKKLSILDTRDAQGYELHQFAPTRIVDLGNDEFVLECYIKQKQDILVKIKILK